MLLAVMRCGAIRTRTGKPRTEAESSQTTLDSTAEEQQNLAQKASLPPRIQYMAKPPVNWKNQTWNSCCKRCCARRMRGEATAGTEFSAMSCRAVFT